MEHVGTFYSGWLIWAVIAAFVAWDKNRSGLIWFLITWFFGPLALVFLFFFMDTIKKKDSSGG